MRLLALAIVVACTDPPVEPELLPRCADVGCPLAPSGDPVSWAPCAPDAGTCYCGAPVPVACTP